MDYTDRNGTDEEAQVFTGYRRGLSAPRAAARREILAKPGDALPLADQQTLIWQRGTATLARTSQPKSMTCPGLSTD